MYFFGTDTLFDILHLIQISTLRIVLIVFGKCNQLTLNQLTKAEDTNATNVSQKATTKELPLPVGVHIFWINQ